MKIETLLQYLAPTQLDVLYSMVGSATPEDERDLVLARISEYKHDLCGLAAVYLEENQVVDNSLIEDK